MGKSLLVNNPTVISYAADMNPGAVKQILVTLSGAPGTVTSITLPSDVNGFGLYPSSVDVVYALDDAPAACATSSSAAIAATAFSLGDTAKTGLWTYRTVPRATSHTLRLRGAAGSEVILVSIF